MIRDDVPLLKWVGGKRREAPQIVPHVLERLRQGGRYLEAFAGSAAVLMVVADEVEESVLNDVNPLICSLYESVVEDPDELYDRLMRYVDRGTVENAYYGIRSEGPPNGDRVGSAAWLLYVNRLCFNGIFRVNGDGRFNVPYGKYKNPYFPTLSHLRTVGDILGRTTVTCGDWSSCVEAARPNDVVLMDPPYFGTFDDYARPDHDVDPTELCEVSRRKWEQGCHFLFTVPSVPEIVDGLTNWCDRLRLVRRSVTVGQKGSAPIDHDLWVSRFDRGRDVDVASDLLGCV